MTYIATFFPPSRRAGIVCLAAILAATGLDVQAEEKINISGVYPHLAMTNAQRSGESGIGAVVSWADRLWTVTYSPHHPRGGPDKLYEITPDLEMIVRPESVGGIPANRFIHTATNQLNIGPYFIDADRTVRTPCTCAIMAIPPSISPWRFPRARPIGRRRKNGPFPQKATARSSSMTWMPSGFG